MALSPTERKMPNWTDRESHLGHIQQLPSKKTSANRSRKSQIWGLGSAFSTGLSSRGMIAISKMLNFGHAQYMVNRALTREVVALQVVEGQVLYTCGAKVFLFRENQHSPLTQGSHP